MGGKQDKRQEPGKGREAQEHQRRGDPAHPRPGKSREQGEKQGKKETSHRREDDLIREEDLHDETF
ncbi:hypothetical protein ACGFYQ_07495 [Streptomyces sp. NPDC048258]|uniref:hypothetical protein n=1 Tax=Streptomyces sp. NPDC048258 TaxID=3365527 RepID=UPI0037237EA7